MQENTTYKYFFKNYIEQCWEVTKKKKSLNIVMVYVLLTLVHFGPCTFKMFILVFIILALVHFSPYTSKCSFWLLYFQLWSILVIEL